MCFKQVSTEVPTLAVSASERQYLLLIDLLNQYILNSSTAAASASQSTTATPTSNATLTERQQQQKQQTSEENKVSGYFFFAHGVWCDSRHLLQDKSPVDVEVSLKLGQFFININDTPSSSSSTIPLASFCIHVLQIDIEKHENADIEVDFTHIFSFVFDS